jgi:hypothetical protein
MKKKFLQIWLLILLLTVITSGCGGGQDVSPPGGEVLEPKSLIEARCTRCHGLDNVYKTINSDEWPGIVDRMMQIAPRLLDEAEKEAVVKYLQENYGE